MFCDQDDYDCDAGWVLYNLGSYNASESHYLVFEVRSQQGGDDFGIGIKDNRNTEVKIYNVADYLSSHFVTPNWQTIRVPLSEFSERNLELSSISNVSVLVDANKSNQREIKFDIANLRFE